MLREPRPRPSTPSRRRTPGPWARPVTALVAVLAAAAAGCLPVHRQSLDGVDASAAAPVGTEPAQTPAEAARTLEAEILPVPPGATAWTKQPTGVLGLDQYIDAMYDPADRAAARGLALQRRFVTAVRHGWTSADDSQDEVILIRYRAASGAQSMRLNLCHTWQKDSTVTWFAGPTDDSCGVDHKGLDSDGFTSSEVFTARGSLIVWAIHFSAGSPDREATGALAQRQLNAVHG